MKLILPVPLYFLMWLLLNLKLYFCWTVLPQRKAFINHFLLWCTSSWPYDLQGNSVVRKLSTTLVLFLIPARIHTVSFVIHGETCFPKILCVKQNRVGKTTGLKCQGHNTQKRHWEHIFKNALTHIEGELVDALKQFIDVHIMKS